jgi:hypothetical protein
VLRASGHRVPVVVGLFYEGQVGDAQWADGGGGEGSWAESGGADGRGVEGRGAEGLGDDGQGGEIHRGPSGPNMNLPLEPSIKGQAPIEMGKGGRGPRGNSQGTGA